LKAPGRPAVLSTQSHRRALRRRWLGSVLTALVVLGIGAWAVGSATAQTSANNPPSANAAQAATRLLPTYQMRCWQHGQLVLEEALTQAPPEAAGQSIRLQGSAAGGTAVLLLNVGAATCLIKPAPAR
jgi:hypothetical protein